MVSYIGNEEEVSASHLNMATVVGWVDMKLSAGLACILERMIPHLLYFLS